MAVRCAVVPLVTVGVSRKEGEKMPVEKKTSDAQRRAVAKYHAEKVEDIKIRVPKGHKAMYKAAAAIRGLSLNQFAIDAMDEKMARDGTAHAEEIYKGRPGPHM